ncbi:MAG: HAMP domain-containing histidine kinase [Planctomycetes bacterium]|nr:HAMP domain-containing histidine kinase [Planctomycetota bacterium]
MPEAREFDDDDDEDDDEHERTEETPLRPKLAAILLLIVLLPLGLLAWLGLRVARDEQERVEHQFREVLRAQLNDTDSAIAALLDERQRELLKLTEFVLFDTASLRTLVERNPIAQALFVLDPKGERLHPPPGGPLNTAEREFLERAGQVWRDKGAFYRPAEGPNGAASAARGYGWYVWYWGAGTNLLFWRRAASGHVIGVELSRTRLLADIVAELPGTDALAPALPHGRIVLVDPGGSPLYQWGAHEPAAGEKPQAALALSPPLAAWRLDYFAASGELKAALRGGLRLTLVAGLLGLGIVLVGVAFYVYRETSREMREAAQRVNFVNQVSHELKTPLTNIRMYAELLESGVADDEERRSRYLGVIVTESERLSRLIANVLTLARKQRGKLTLHPAAGCVDERAAAVIERFRPLLAAKGVEVAFDPAAPASVSLDGDALEQILGNLLSNVEKYAASGGHVAIATLQDGDTTTLTVSDRGPGIPKGHEARLFEPFHRVSDRLNEGVTGTGIGLAIARDLARLHGGDLALCPADAGACFKLTLRTPQAG